MPQPRGNDTQTTLAAVIRTIKYFVIQCEDCDRELDCSASALASKFGCQFPVSDLRERLRCQRCSSARTTCTIGHRLVMMQQEMDRSKLVHREEGGRVLLVARGEPPETRPY